MSLLFNKIPDAYMTVKGGINTFYDKKEISTKNKKRNVFFYQKDGEYRLASSVFRIQKIRIINVGKHHIDFQIESSKTKEFGILRSAKLFTDKRGKYFEWKNNKYFISKRSIVF